MRSQLSNQLRVYVPWACGVALVASIAVASNWGIKMHMNLLQEQLDVQAVKANLRFDRPDEVLKSRKA